MLTARLKRRRGTRIWYVHFVEMTEEEEQEREREREEQKVREEEHRLKELERQGTQGVHMRSGWLPKNLEAG